MFHLKTEFILPTFFPDYIAFQFFLFIRSETNTDFYRRFLTPAGNTQLFVAEHNTSGNTVQCISQENLPINSHHTQPRCICIRKMHIIGSDMNSVCFYRQKIIFLCICGLATRTEARAVIWRCINPYKTKNATEPCKMTNSRFYKH